MSRLRLSYGQKAHTPPSRRYVSHFFGMPIDPGPSKTPTNAPHPDSTSVSEPLKLAPKRDAKDTWDSKQKSKVFKGRRLEPEGLQVGDISQAPVIRTYWKTDPDDGSANARPVPLVPRSLKDTIAKLKLGMPLETRTLGVKNFQEYLQPKHEKMNHQLREWRQREAQEDHVKQAATDPDTWLAEGRSARQRHIDIGVYDYEVKKHWEAHYHSVNQRHMYIPDVQNIFLKTLENMRNATAGLADSERSRPRFNFTVDSLSGGQYAQHFDYLRIGTDLKVAYRDAQLPYVWDTKSNSNELHYVDQTVHGRRIYSANDALIKPFPTIPRFPMRTSEIESLLEEIIAYKIPEQLHKFLMEPGSKQTDYQSQAIFDILSYPGHSDFLTTPILNMAIQFYLYQGHPGRARAVFLIMTNLQLKPDIHTFYAFLRDAASQHDMVRFAYHLDGMLTTGIAPDSHTWAALLECVVDLGNKEKIIAAMNFLGLQPEQYHARETFDLLLPKESLHLIDPRDIGEKLRRTLERLVMTKKVLHVTMWTLFMKNKDFAAINFLLETCQKYPRIRPDTAMLHMMVRWMCTRKRMSKVVRILRLCENRWGVQPSTQTLEVIKQGAFLSGAYNMGRVVYRHAAMTGRLTFSMKARIGRHLNGLGPRNGEFGKFCVGVDLADTPDLLTNAIWALEAEEMRWPEPAEPLSIKAVLARNLEFEKRVREFRSKLFKADELSFIKWKPARSLVEDLEEALQEDRQRGWGKEQRAKGYISWVWNHETDQRIYRVRREYEVKRIVRGAEMQMHVVNDPEVIAQLDGDVVWRSLRRVAVPDDWVAHDPTVTFSDLIARQKSSPDPQTSALFAKESIEATSKLEPSSGSEISANSSSDIATPIRHTNSSEVSPRIPFLLQARDTVSPNLALSPAQSSSANIFPGLESSTAATKAAENEPIEPTPHLLDPTISFEPASFEPTDSTEDSSNGITSMEPTGLEQPASKRALRLAKRQVNEYLTFVPFYGGTFKPDWMVIVEPESEPVVAIAAPIPSKDVSVHGTDEFAFGWASVFGFETIPTVTRLPTYGHGAPKLKRSVLFVSHGPKRPVYFGPRLSHAELVRRKKERTATFREGSLAKNARKAVALQKALEEEEKKER